MAQSIKQLRSASFRGVVFHVTETDHTAGRRLVVHEYPERDEPFTEDLGKAAKTYTVKGFFVGDHYIEQMRSLEEKLETKGAGELIHPWLGRLMVVPQNTSIHFSQRLRRVDFDITFTESGAQTYPTQDANTAFVTKQAASKLHTAALSALSSSLKISSLQDYVSRTIVKNVNESLGFDAIGSINRLFDVSDKVASLMSAAVSLMSSSPAGFGEKLAAALGLSGYATSVAAWRNVVKDVARLTEADELNTHDSALYSEGTQSHTEAHASECYNNLIRQVEIANAVGASANAGTELDRASPTDAPSVMAYEDLMDLRDTLLKTIDQEMIKVSDDGVYAALQDARAAVWRDLTIKAESKARLIEYTPAAVLPAVVIAYERYEDASRDEEIVGRNNIARPGFVPVQPLKLLSE